MSFGEKLQQLRRARALSQEQLAGELNVTRQAVSRWELNETLPDTDNVIRLSRIFGVSTDYLLLEEAERTAQPDPPVREDTKGEIRLRTSVVGGLCICAMGLICCITGLLSTGDARMSMVFLGLVEQIAGVELVEMMGAWYKRSREQRCRFYAAACWLLWPMPLYFSVSLLSGLIPWPYPSLLFWIVFYLLYLAVSAATTAALLRRQRG